MTLRLMKALVVISAFSVCAGFLSEWGWIP
jgi:hypothetical protein